MMHLELINKMNNSNWKIYLAITGGGQSFIGDYLSVSGGSKVIKGAIVPYSKEAFDKFVKVHVDNYASDKAARQLAVAAYNEVQELGADKYYALGLGATCSLAKDNERKGREHKIYVAVHHMTATNLYSIILDQGRTRWEEELLARELIFQALAFGTFCGSFNFDRMSWLKEIETFWQESAGKREHIDLVLGQRGMVLKNAVVHVPKLVVYPGSFFPIHDGHRQIFKLATEILWASPNLEVSVTNVDKGQMDFIEISNRENHLWNWPLILTNAPTFVDKARLFRREFPNKEIIFVVGADTWNRIWNEKYAGPSGLVESVFSIQNVKFLVFGRPGTEINTCWGWNLRIHDDRATNCNFNISSTGLRSK